MQRVLRASCGVVAVLLLISSGAGLSGCRRTPIKKEGVAEPAKGATAKTAGARFLIFNNLKEPEYIDPTMISGVYERNVVDALFEGLLSYDPKDLHPLPGIALRWEVSADGQTYTFFLRHNAQWSDGKPITAHDFVYAWERVLHPKTASSYAFIMFYIKNAKAYNSGRLTDPTQLGFKALDNTTLQVTLENPTPFFPYLAAFHTYMPVPKWAVEQHGSNWTRPEHIVTSGAFVLKSWVPHKEIVVAKNPNYWDAANVQLAGIRFLPIEDHETALKLYESGELDINWEILPTRAAGLMDRPDFVQFTYLESNFYRINTTRPPLNDPRVRRALALAVDRKVLAERYLQKAAAPIGTITPPGLPGYASPEGIAFNPTEGKRLLAEAGFGTAKPFPTLTILFNTEARHRMVAEVIQQMWKEHLGITVELHNEEWKSYLKTMEQMNYDIARSGWVGDYLDPNTFLDLWTSTSTQNWTGWVNRQYDALIGAAETEANPQKRIEQLQKAEALLLAETPLLPLFTMTKQMLVRPYVKGFYPNVLDNHAFKWISIDEAAAAAVTAK